MHDQPQFSEDYRALLHQWHELNKEIAKWHCAESAPRQLIIEAAVIAIELDRYELAHAIANDSWPNIDAFEFGNEYKYFGEDDMAVGLWAAINWEYERAKERGEHE